MMRFCARRLLGLATSMAVVLATMSSAVSAVECPALSVTTCALPFPSNQYAVADGATETGIRIEFPDDVLAASAYGALPDTTRPSAIFAGADGYAASTPVIFELTQDVALGTIPQDGGNLVLVFDADTGQRIPVVVDFDRSSQQPGGAPNIVQAWPRTRFEYGHRYVAYILGSVETESGQSAALPNSDVSAWAQGKGGFVEFATAVFQFFGGIAGATEFTVRSEHNAQGPLDDMVATTKSQSHPISAINVQPNFGLFGAHVNTVVFGHVAVTDFRDPSTGALQWYPGFQGYTSQIPFILTLPTTPAGPNGAPVVIYGHGLGFFKETVLAVSEANAKHGMATLSMDQPLHPRGGNDPFVFDVLTPSEFERVRSLPYQSVIHHTSLLQALQTEFAGRDWHPWRLEADVFPDFFNHGDGVADLDTSYVLYQGSSLGGVLGAAFVAQNPQIDAAMLQVAGAGTLHTLINSLYWSVNPEAQFSGLLPDSATPAEQAAIYGIATHALDPSDASNFLHRIPESGQSILSIYTHGDPVVYNRATERLIEMTEGVLYGPRRYTVPHLPYVQGGRPADGNGAYQMYGLPSDFGDELSQLNHIRFLTDPGGLDQLDGWLQDRLAEAGY